MGDKLKPEIVDIILYKKKNTKIDHNSNNKEGKFQSLQSVSANKI